MNVSLGGQHSKGKEKGSSSVMCEVRGESVIGEGGRGRETSIPPSSRSLLAPRASRLNSLPSSPLNASHAGYMIARCLR